MKRFDRLPHPILSVVLTMLALTVAAMPSRAQFAASESSAAAPGTEYYVGFMQNDDATGGGVAKFMGVMVTSQVSTVFTVEIPGEEPKTYSTQPGQFTTVAVPRVFEHTISEDTVMEPGTRGLQAIHITSRAPISVFALNARHQSTAGYVALPVSSWGTRYVALGLPNGFGERTSELMIVTAHDDTYIQFMPTARTVRQYAGTVKQLKLDRGRTYFVQALAQAAGVGDLSGSEIIASRPVGLIVGHVRTPLTIDGTLPSDPQSYQAHQAYMAVPDSAWGYDFVSTPLRSSGDRFRVMTSRESSVIVIHHGPAGIGRDTLALDAGEVRDIHRVAGEPITGAVEWRSTAPAMVLQMRTGGRYGDPAQSPAIVPLTPLASMTTRSAFVAPERIADGAFDRHRLALVVSVPPSMRGNPSEAFRQIRLDGEPLEVFTPDGAPRPVGETGLYYASMTIRSGGHILVASNGVTFHGILSGDNGTINRDAYLWALPTWGEPEELDVSAPYVVSLRTPAKGTVEVTVSDVSGGYFSGVGDIQAQPGSSGWIRTSFNAPMPNDAGVATFRAIADPSGPLSVLIRDRDGNAKDTILSGSICFKTARAAESMVTIRTTAGRAGSGSLELVANECGDVANVRGIAFGSGTVAVHLTATFDGAPTTTIPANGRARLTIDAGTAIPQGTHETTMRIAVDDSVLVIPVRVEVGAPTSADDESVEIAALRVYPNPASAGVTISFGRLASTDARVTISDNLGRTVRTLDAAAIAGRDEIRWDGRDASGAPVAAGTYLVSLADHGIRTVAGVSVVR